MNAVFTSDTHMHQYMMWLLRSRNGIFERIKRGQATLSQ